MTLIPTATQGNQFHQWGVSSETLLLGKDFSFRFMNETGRISVDDQQTEWRAPAPPARTIDTESTRQDFQQLEKSTGCRCYQNLPGKTFSPDIEADGS